MSNFSEAERGQVSSSYSTFLDSETVTAPTLFHVPSTVSGRDVDEAVESTGDGGGVSSTRIEESSVVTVGESSVVTDINTRAPGE